MTVTELQSLGGIYLSNIMDGFSEYESETLVLDETLAYDYFYRIWKSQNYQDMYVDFYYFTLSKIEQEKVRSVLSPVDLFYLDTLNHLGVLHPLDTPNLSSDNISNSHLIFPIEEALLRIICKLNASEMLFSTIYCTNPAKTYWGNYKHEYVMFK